MYVCALCKHGDSMFKCICILYMYTCTCVNVNDVANVVL